MFDPHTKWKNANPTEVHASHATLAQSHGVNITLQNDVSVVLVTFISIIKVCLTG